ncbi:reverse transcriptase, partial [Globisporangium polare]
QQQQQRQQPSGPVTQQAYPIYNQAYGSDRIHERPHLRQSAAIISSQASGSGSPNLSEFKNIALSKVAPSSSRSSTSSRGDAAVAARTQTNYKPQATHTSRVTRSPLVPSRPMRTSRYLREVDRRSILQRIENGEKQANLAKEYQVSRAAISNLKQRRNRNKEGHQQQQHNEGHDHSESGGHEDSGDQDGEDGEVKEEDEDGDGSDSQYCQLRLEAMRQQQHLETARMHAAALSVTQETNQSEHHHRQSLGEYELKRHAHTGRHSYDTSASDQEIIAVRSPYLLPPAAPLRQSPLLVPTYSEPTALDDSMEKLLERVTEVTTASMEILFSRLVDQRTDARMFQTSLSRVARLLLEHALSLFPVQDARIPMQYSGSQASAAASYYAGTEPTRPTCAIAMSECGGGALLLREFQTIEPYSGIGFVSLPSTSSAVASNDGEHELQMPRNLLESNVVLIVELRGLTSCENVANALRAVLRCGVRQQYLVLVALCSHKEALVRILKSFAKLRIVTAKVFSQDDPSAEALAQVLHSRLVIQEQQQSDANTSNNVQRLR